MSSIVSANRLTRCRGDCALSTPQGHDIVIIGGGPAGLSAARATAGLGLDTLLLECLSQVGELAHPCGGALAPHPGYVSGRRTAEGLSFDELGLTVPAAVIVGAPTTQRYVSPGGYEMHIVFPQRDDFPIAVVDKRALLGLLAAQARSSGAELRYAQPVVGLLMDGERVRGVQTREGPICARVVISAEGIGRRFVEQAGLYAGTAAAWAHAVLAFQALQAPAVGLEHVGQISTLGQRYTSIPHAMGTVDMPAAARADVYFSVFGTGAKLDTVRRLADSLEEYKQNDPRVCELLVGSNVVRSCGCHIMLRSAPRRAVSDGFIGAGDSVTAGGQLGIVPAMYLGHRAAEVAAAAIHNGDVSAAKLTPYDALLRGGFLRGVETEGKIMLGLATMTDAEIDRVCQTFGHLDLAPFFFGQRWPILRESLRWMWKAWPLILRDWKLIGRVMARGSD